MTVAELIDVLENLPDDCRVKFSPLGVLAVLDGDGGFYGYIDLKDGRFHLYKDIDP